MRKKYIIFMVCFTVILLFLYNREKSKQLLETHSLTQRDKAVEVKPTTKRQILQDGLSVIRFDEDYGFQAFLDANGASSDEQVVEYLMEHVLTNITGLQFLNNIFGCSTIQAQNQE